MEYQRVRRFAERHGEVTVMDTTGRTRTLPSGESDIFELLANADRFLWAGTWRSPGQMQALIAQSERGLYPGCLDCERLEHELMHAREQDRKEGNLEGRYELHALYAFKEHRLSHQ